MDVAVDCCGEKADFPTERERERERERDREREAVLPAKTDRICGH